MLVKGALPVGGIISYLLHSPSLMATGLSDSPVAIRLGLCSSLISLRLDYQLCIYDLLVGCNLFIALACIVAQRTPTWNHCRWECCLEKLNTIRTKDHISWIFFEKSFSELCILRKVSANSASLYKTIAYKWKGLICLFIYYNKTQCFFMRKPCFP